MLRAVLQSVWQPLLQRKLSPKVISSHCLSSPMTEIRRFLQKTQACLNLNHFFRHFDGDLPNFCLKLRENCDNAEKPVATATSRMLISE